MKSRDILERDNVKNAAEEEKKRHDKNQERFERFDCFILTFLFLLLLLLLLFAILKPIVSFSYRPQQVIKLLKVL